jgi:hypothetical protein
MSIRSSSSHLMQYYAKEYDYKRFKWQLMASSCHQQFSMRQIFQTFSTDLFIKCLPISHCLELSPTLANYQPFEFECWLYCAEQRQDCKFDALGEPALYCSRSTMDNRSSHVLYISLVPTMFDLVTRDQYPKILRV